jgi:hypothetical protein
MIALNNQVSSYKFISNIISNKMTELPREEENQQALPQHQNIRGKAYYSQIPINFKTYDAN